MTEFSFERLRRRPDVEADNLFAVDAADRLLLDTAAPALAGAAAGEVVVIGDQYGALTLGAAALYGARGFRVHQDPLSGERALANNAAELGLGEAYRSLPLSPELLDGARVLLLRLPRGLDALDEIADAMVRHASADAIVYAGAMAKHMTRAMNGVLGRYFGSVRAGRARQKARVLTVSAPDVSISGRWPHAQFHVDLGLWVCAHGTAFAGTKVDIGTRFLLGFLDQARPDASHAIDLGCGTGILSAALAASRPAITVLATDQSAAAVASARATMQANGLAERVRVVRDDALSAQPDASAELILLNPPFHIGASVHAGAAVKLIEDAARALAPGGELWTVFNSHLAYTSMLNRTVGPTRVAGRNAKFTVVVSTRPM